MHTPEDGDNWMLAKLNLQITDLGYAQIVEHLGKVNTITSLGKLIATHSTLSPFWNSVEMCPFRATNIAKTKGHVPWTGKKKKINHLLKK